MLLIFFSKTRNYIGFRMQQTALQNSLPSSSYSILNPLVSIRHLVSLLKQHTKTVRAANTGVSLKPGSGSGRGSVSETGFEPGFLKTAETCSEARNIAKKALQTIQRYFRYNMRTILFRFNASLFQFSGFFVGCAPRNRARGDYRIYLTNRRRQARKRAIAFVTLLQTFCCALFTYLWFTTRNAAKSRVGD